LAVLPAKSTLEPATCSGGMTNGSRAPDNTSTSGSKVPGTPDTPDCAGFAAGLSSDRDDVVAGLTQPWSSGPVEGHVNRIKTIKRQMYGRANLDLLRKTRVLATP
jgi:hypothetical protein